MKIRFCKNCLYSTLHPLGITIFENGLCSGCVIHQEKNKLNWKSRWEQLEKIITKYYKSSNEYDCIVPVTGAQDSFFIVYNVVKKLGLKPLLVNHNKYFNTEIGIHNLANLRIKFNCDILYQNINPETVRKLTKNSLIKMGSMYWPVIAGNTSFPVNIAKKYKIPLIIWGAHQGLEQVGMFSHLHNIEMTKRYRKDHDLMGFDESNLISNFNNLNEKDLYNFKYPSLESIYRNKIIGIYLGNYIRWDPKVQHEKMINKFDYKTDYQNRTFEKYENTDCYNYMNIHDLLKLYKHGYSKVTDHVCREIRFKRISRDYGIKLIKKYERKKIKYLDLFCEWLGIDNKSLEFSINQHRNPIFWRKIDNRFQFKGLSTLLKDSGKITSKDSKFENSYVLNPFKTTIKKYVTFGKGV